MRKPEAVSLGTAITTAGQRGRNLWGTTRRFAGRQPLGFIGLLICVLVLFGGAFAPWVDRYDPNDGESLVRLQAPRIAHWLGTDEQGRDVYSRIVWGARVSIYVAFFSIAIGTTAGYLLGIFSGYIGGKMDLLVQRIVDGMLALPSILLALVLVATLGSGVDKVILAISIVFAPRAARVSRGVVLSLKENIYVDAAKVIGASTLRVIFRHIIPNSLAPYLILASAGLGTAILIEASLSFLGLGVPPPHPSWGRMLAGNTALYAIGAPWLVLAPGAAIMVLVLAFNFFGDALRDLWDPKLRGR